MKSSYLFTLDVNLWSCSILNFGIFQFFIWSVESLELCIVGCLNFKRGRLFSWNLFRQKCSLQFKCHQAGNIAEIFPFVKTRGNWGKALPIQPRLFSLRPIFGMHNLRISTYNPPTKSTSLADHQREKWE